MAVNPDSSIDKLLDDLRSLISSPAPQAAPGLSPPGVAQKEFVASPGGWTAPIHGTWHNLGGFDASAARYDDLAKNPKATKGRGHFGVDMGAAAGTPVYAMGAGVVNSVGTDPMGGNIVGVQHANGVWSYYAHLSTAKVQKGDKVDSNTIVGTVGNTGNPGNPKNPLMTQEGGRTWPHLHFGVKNNGSWVDPAKYFNIPAYDREYARNPGKYQNFWLNDQAKQEAQAFNMKSHVAQQRRTALSRADKLMKIAFEFAKLSDQAKWL